MISNGKWFLIHLIRPYHDLNYCISDLTMKYIGWSPQIEFKDSIKYITQWYLQHPEWLEI